MHNHLFVRTKTQSRRLALGLLFGAGLATSTGAIAETVDPQYVYNSALAATCASCHGTKGVSVPGAGVPVINDLSAEQIAESMRGYKDGGREGTIMHQLAKGYTDEQIEIIAQVLGKK